MALLTFKKEEKLREKNDFNQIVSRGNILHYGLFKIYILTSKNQLVPAKVAFSIPKRYIKLAVKRNLLKRRLSEIYRIYKNEFYKQLTNKNMQIKLLIIYANTDVKSYNELEKQLIKSLKKMLNKI